MAVSDLYCGSFSNVKTISLTIAMASVAVLGAVSANAASPEEEILEPFEKCKSIGDDTQRLACFDAAASTARTIAVEKRDKRRVRQKEDFGLSGLDLAKRDEKAPDRVAERNELEPDQITAKLTDAYTNMKTGRRIFLLDNGQIWREVSGSKMRRAPKAGAAITVKKGGFGSFKLRAEGKKGFAAVKRVK